MTDSAIQWMRAHSEERWFMVVNYNAPHSPYWPPDELWLPFKPLLENVDNFKWPYLGEIKYVDVHLQRLLDAVDALNLSERTLVIFTSDHGEIMDFRHRGWNETFRRRTYHSHGVTLYDEETRVPLVFRQNGRIPTGQRVDAPFSHVDLPPTILGLLGLPPEPGHLGRDFSNAVLGTGPSPPDAPIRSEARLSTSLVWQGLKYIVHDPSMKVEFALPTLYDPARGNEELYDLNVDPDELNNLAWESDSSRLESMRALLKQQDEELEQRQSHGPWTHLRFHGGLRQQQFTGSIHTEGTIARLELVGEPDQNRCTLDSEKTIHVDAQSGGGRGLRFVTEPPNAAVHLQLAIDSVVIQADRVFVGTYGLNLLQDPLRIDRPEQWALTAAGGGEPRITAESKSGVFLWRDQGFDSPNPVNSPDVMDESVRKMMQDWGYQ
jgi:hypothetical protein